MPPINLSLTTKMIDKRLLSILVCPVTQTPLEYDPANQELIAWSSGLAYPIRDDIPIMLESEARKLTLEEIDQHNAK